MNIKKATQTFVIALAMMIMLAIGSTTAFGQRQLTDEQSTNEQSNALVGVWESVAPAAIDCQTGMPIPGPTIRALYTFNQGGTMSEENTDPIEGPFRTSAAGIWKRTFGRNYVTVYTHYGFDPVSRELAAIVKARTNIMLSRDSDSFTERGTFEVLDPNGNPFPEPITGCFAATWHRLKF